MFRHCLNFVTILFRFTWLLHFYRKTFAQNLRRTFYACFPRAKKQRLQASFAFRMYGWLLEDEPIFLPFDKSKLLKCEKSSRLSIPKQILTFLRCSGANKVNRSNTANGRIKGMCLFVRTILNFLSQPKLLWPKAYSDDMYYSTRVQQPEGPHTLVCKNW